MIYSLYILMSSVVWAHMTVNTHDIDVWDRLCTVGRDPCTKETLPDFHEWCRVTRHPLLFRGLTGCQRIPRVWGVTTWYQSLGIRIPRELGFEYPSPLGVVRCKFRYKIT